MKKKLILIYILALICAGGVMADTTMNFLTKGFADTLYCSKGGDCVLGNITVSALNLFNGSINFINVTIINYNVTGEVNVDGNVIADKFFGIYDWIILNDISRYYLFFNGTDLGFNETTLNETILDVASVYNDTDSILWENSTGVAKLKSSQDIDMQDGDISIRDSENEFHNISRTLQIIDEMNRNITLSGLNGTFKNDGNLTLTTKTGESIIVNIDKTEIILDKNVDSIIITSGTNESPILNQIVYSDSENPVLTKRTTLGLKAPSVATFLQGANYTYVSAIGLATIDNLVGGLFNRFFRDGSTYRSGFVINVSTNMVNISTGVISFLFDEIEIISNHSTSELHAHIHEDGAFHQHFTIDDDDTYNGGEIVSNNKYFNAVFGIAITHDGEGVMYTITQDLPSTEYTKAIDAEVDIEDTINFFPPHDIVSLAFIPVVRVVIRRSGGINTIQTLSNGLLYDDLRGTVTKTSASPPPSGITAHFDMTNLDFATALHTGFASTEQLDSIENFTMQDINDSFGNWSQDKPSYVIGAHTTDTTIGNCSGLNTCSNVIYNNNLSQYLTNETDANFDNLTSTTLLTNNITCFGGTCEMSNVSTSMIEVDHIVEKTSGHGVVVGNVIINESTIKSKTGDLNIDSADDVFIFANDFVSIEPEGNINLQPSGDPDNLIQLSTTDDQTKLNFRNQDGLITADDGCISLDDEDLETTGDITANSFNGSWNGTNQTDNLFTDSNVQFKNTKTQTLNATGNATIQSLRVNESIGVGINPVSDISIFISPEISLGASESWTGVSSGISSINLTGNAGAIQAMEFTSLLVGTELGDWNVSTLYGATGNVGFVADASPYYGGTTSNAKSFRGASAFLDLGHTPNPIVPEFNGLEIPSPSVFGVDLIDVYGVKIGDMTKGTNNWGIFIDKGRITLDATGADGSLEFGENQERVMYDDTINLFIDANATGDNGNVYITTNVSVQNLIERGGTYSLEKDGEPFQYIQDESYYKNPDGSRDYEKFFGYATIKVKDECWEVFNHTHYCYFNIKNFTANCQDEPISNWKKDYDVHYTEDVYNTVCSTKQEEGVIYHKEVDVLRQGVYNLSQENQMLKDRILILEQQKGLGGEAFKGNPDGIPLDKLIEKISWFK